MESSYKKAWLCVEFTNDKTKAYDQNFIFKQFLYLEIF